MPIHKDEKLARSLSVLDIGEYIPQELYSIVAEVLVFVDDMDKIQSKVKKNNESTRSGSKKKKSRRENI